MSEPLVSVVVPNWNGAALLPACLDSLQQQTYPWLEVIVVDNASSDGSAALVRDRYPQVKLIELPENRGFTGACNAGMQAALGEIVALFNNDAEAAPGWAAAVVDAFERYPQAGMIASKMLLHDRRDTLHTAGDYFRVDGRAGNRGVWQPDGPAYQREQPVFGACGGSAAYRRAMLDEVGLLDDDFFFSLEDVDLAWRGQLAGWSCIYTPAAVVYHHLAATGGGVTASYYDGRNGLWVIAKNVPGPLLQKHGRKMLGAQARQAWEAIRAWRGEAARARLRGMLAGLLTLPKALRKRRAVQALRRVPVDQIEAVLTPVHGEGGPHVSDPY